MNPAICRKVILRLLFKLKPLNSMTVRNVSNLFINLLIILIFVFMPTRLISRSTVNQDQYAAPEFPKSGFAPSYSRHFSAIIGRIHASGYQYVMPGDKIYGSNKGDFTFNRIVTPMLTPLDCGQYTFYLPFRAIDTTFEDGMTPTELNAMSANWHTPKCNTADIVEQLLMRLYPVNIAGSEHSINVCLFTAFNLLLTNPTATISNWVNAVESAIPWQAFLYNTGNGIVTSLFKSLTDEESLLVNDAKNMYIDDALIDISDNIRAKLGTESNPAFSDTSLLSDFLMSYLDVVFTPWIGRYSYYGEFRFNYLRPKDIYVISHPKEFGLRPITTFKSLFDSTPCCEYALRVMYAIWYERFRDVHLEPVSTTLPYWRRFGPTSILDIENGGNLCYLLLRIRSWYDDPFTSAQVDDISRHVYAPVASNKVVSDYHGSPSNNLDTQNSDGEDLESGGFHKPSAYNLGYVNPISDETVVIHCPVPTNINDVLSSIDRDFVDVYGLDLNTLRQSQMLEKYLKRNYLFGDEYQDRMLAHYGSRVSDMRINRPEMLGQSLNQSNMNQEVSNVSTEFSQVGDRTATATVQFGGDDYGTYCEEFGMVINLLTFMPRAMYDGLDAHLLLDKQTDFPLPEFASNNEEFGRKTEIACSAIAPVPVGQGASPAQNYIFGRYPAYHIWRGRTDEVGGMFLDELQDCTFRRFFGLYSPETTPKLNYWFLHCRPNLGMFANTVRYDSQLYGSVEHQFYVERVLPTPVEVI